MVQEVNVPTKYLNKLQKSSSDNILHNRVLNDFAMNPRTIERQKKEHKVSEPVNIPFSFFSSFFNFSLVLFCSMDPRLELEDLRCRDDEELRRLCFL